MMLTVTNNGLNDLPILVLQSQHFVDQICWTYAECFLITEVEGGAGWYDYITSWCRQCVLGNCARVARRRGPNLPLGDPAHGSRHR
jgi:hypothetical protein